MSSAVGADAGVKHLTGVASVTAYAGAALFLVAAAWYALVVEEVVVAAEPRPQAGQSREEWLQTYLSWYTSTLADERFYGGAAIIGFMCLFATAVFVCQRLRRGPLATLGARAVGVGTTMWIIGNVAALGGHHAVGQMTNRGEPLEAVRLILWLIDDVDNAFELAGLAVMGIGFMALAWPPTSVVARRAAWSGFTAVVGLVLLATAAAYAARMFDLVDLLLVVGGVVLLPAWLVWTGRLLRERHVEAAA